MGMDSDSMQDLPTVQKAPPRQWVRLTFTYLLIGLVLFACAGDLSWWQAWVFVVLLLVAGIGSHVWAEQRHPGMMMERVNSGTAQDMKAWDKLLAPLMAVSISFPPVIVAGLDHRFGWSPVFPLWLNLLGFAIIGVGYFVGAWALAENRYFSGVVRIQAERGHTVCESGPYRMVRHPGYAGNLLALPGIVLGLSSLWTLVPVAAAVMIVVVRTRLEDRTLQEELPGYREYAERVSYRLVPGVY